MVSISGKSEGSRAKEPASTARNCGLVSREGDHVVVRLEEAGVRP